MPKTFSSDLRFVSESGHRRNCCVACRATSNFRRHRVPRHSRRSQKAFQQSCWTCVVFVTILLHVLRAHPAYLYMYIYIYSQRQTIFNMCISYIYVYIIYNEIYMVQNDCVEVVHTAWICYEVTFPVHVL